MKPNSGEANKNQRRRVGEASTSNEVITTKREATSKLFEVSDSILAYVFSFLPLNEILGRVCLVCHSMRNKAYASITSVTFAEEMTPFDVRKLVDFIPRFINCKSIQFDGYESMSDIVLATLVKKFPESVTELHVRECNLKNPRIESKTLQVLKFSMCDNLHTVKVDCKNLTKLEFYNCEIINPPKLKCPQLNEIVLFGCSKITDKKIAQILKQFKPTTTTTAATTPNNSNNNNNNNNWLTDSQQRKQNLEEDDEGVLNDSMNADDDQQATNNFNCSAAAECSLKKFSINECEPLQNPIIECDSLEELKLINCRSLSNLLLKCSHLKKLQLNWCENLQNLHLVCDDLEVLDMTGAGVNAVPNQGTGKTTVRESIINAIRDFYGDQIKVIY